MSPREQLKHIQVKHKVSGQTSRVILFIYNNYPPTIVLGKYCQIFNQLFYVNRLYSTAKA